MALAENSGLGPIDAITDLKVGTRLQRRLLKDEFLNMSMFQAKQIEQGKPYLGIDALFTGTNDMRQQKVVETLVSKKEQISLATQVNILVRSVREYLFG